MNRYFVFYGDVFYPMGGMRDFIGSFESMTEAHIAVNSAHASSRKEDEEWEYGWAQIWDSREGKEVFFKGYIPGI